MARPFLGSSIQCLPCERTPSPMRKRKDLVSSIRGLLVLPHLSLPIFASVVLEHELVQWCNWRTFKSLHSEDTKPAELIVMRSADVARKKIRAFSAGNFVDLSAV
ncbi:hypothetical protein HBI56_157500 [Parastagonospora nodorum]|uniref:Uncharacterized protein n=2 Tax=Phaeosphaeria nodorum (strain SN15 / ATCC MYA-4574 / FGSC 10173) TaxID=321614 RepID=A0A7U2EW93_PHANO|nr:hypothetical protein SNOG_02367 [Parastagonospora nodorum SN15]KAH3907376.1 hypothetical protein HBH56_188240 [Parastagonospora nodorum]EAT90579.1 hypothetical protein SNOG_02367 [Parastagonospora nodorum SN15]KAH3925096.1 hypothetical protein HBH54_184050 [Parastagonospora nodorum]KAH3954529.1 hypothetical protein HBH53_023400 [Parastagonospora nodorum]KAH3963883.1 hypothetical protein HBH51_163230 [Parastagonospora nodorum]